MNIELTNALLRFARRNYVQIVSYESEGPNLVLTVENSKKMQRRLKYIAEEKRFAPVRESRSPLWIKGATE